MTQPHDGSIAVSRPEQLRERTKQFAVRTVRLFRDLPRAEEARVIGKQLAEANELLAIFAASQRTARSSQ